MTTSVNVHGIHSIRATHSVVGDKYPSTWVSIYGIDAQGNDRLECTFFTDGNEALAKKIADAINNAMPKLELI